MTKALAFKLAPNDPPWQGAVNPQFGDFDGGHNGHHLFIWVIIPPVKQTSIEVSATGQSLDEVACINCSKLADHFTNFPKEVHQGLVNEHSLPDAEVTLLVSQLTQGVVTLVRVGQGSGKQFLDELPGDLWDDDCASAYAVSVFSIRHDCLTGTNAQKGGLPMFP